jgi:hypothetical protein
LKYGLCALAGQKCWQALSFLNTQQKRAQTNIDTVGDSSCFSVSLIFSAKKYVHP